jgi:hypothetical protein
VKDYNLVVSSGGKEYRVAKVKSDGESYVLYDFTRNSRNLAVPDISAGVLQDVRAEGATVGTTGKTLSLQRLANGEYVTTKFF